MATDPRDVFIDTNILIFASSPAAEFHSAALEALERIEEEGVTGWISMQVVREFLVHMTRTDVLGTHSIGEVIQQVRRLCGHYAVAYDNESVAHSLLDLTDQFSVQGKQIHDTNIVATCLAYGITRLLTGNRGDFKRFDSIVQIETL